MPHSQSCSRRSQHLHHRLGVPSSLEPGLTAAGEMARYDDIDDDDAAVPPTAGAVAQAKPPPPCSAAPPQEAASPSHADDVEALLGGRFDAEPTLRVFRALEQQGLPVPLLLVAGLATGGADSNDAYGGAAPASSEAAARLPVTTAAAREAGEEEEGCAVCLQAYEEGERLRTMPCAHGFHEGCILKWLAVSRVCPLCRFALCG
ncbi:hypothetical protein ACP4OV_003667 [Aristida adscensionis]